MPVQSKTDFTIFYCNLVLFTFLAGTFSVPFWQSSIFEKVGDGSPKHVMLLIGYAVLFILLPLYALSWSVRTFIVSNEHLVVHDMFGLRKRTFSLPTKNGFKISHDSSPYRFRWFPLKNSYYEFKTLHIESMERITIRIQSRYLKNFDEVNIAARRHKASK